MIKEKRRIRAEVEVKIHVPAQANPGRYSSTLTMAAAPDGSQALSLEVPILIDVQTEK